MVAKHYLSRLVFTIVLVVFIANPIAVIITDPIAVIITALIVLVIVIIHHLNIYIKKLIINNINVDSGAFCYSFVPKGPYF